MERQLGDYLTPPVVLIIFLLILSLFIMFPVLNMVILGAILALGLRPIAKRINEKLKYSSISIILAMIIIIIPLILLFAYIVGVSLDFFSQFASNQVIKSFDLNQTIGSTLSYLHLNDSVNIVDSISTGLNDIGTYVVNYSVKLAGKIANISLQLFIFICSLFYFTRDGDKCFNFVKSFVPDKNMQFFKDTVLEVKNVLKSIFYGHFLTSLIIGIIAAIGYSFLGYPYGIFLGVITGILQLIPIFGPWPVYWALAIIDVINGNYARVIVVLLFGFGLSLSDMYIRPALSSHYADIPPLILLIGFLAGPLVYGIVGFIIGPLILGITYAVIISYKNEKDKVKEAS